MTSLYSFWLKRKLLVDVIVLAGLYTLRIIAGAAAVDVPLTMWMLAFSMFFFLSLAFAKRYSELIVVEEAGEDEIHGRGYQVRDLRIIESVGPASGYLAVLVFCNYLNDPKSDARSYDHVRICSGWWRPCCCTGSPASGSSPAGGCCTMTRLFSPSATAEATSAAFLPRSSWGWRRFTGIIEPLDIRNSSWHQLPRLDLA